MRHSLQFLFFLRVLVFVQLNVFAREVTPVVSKGPGEEGGRGEGEYGGQRAKERETEDTSNERRIEKLGGKLIGASG